MQKEKNTDKCHGILRCSADGERGVLVELFEVSLTSCSSATDDRFFVRRC